MLIFRAQEAENGHLTRILRVIARNMEFSIVAMRRTDRLRCSEGWVSVLEKVSGRNCAVLLGNASCPHLEVFWIIERKE